MPEGKFNKLVGFILCWIVVVLLGVFTGECMCNIIHTDENFDTAIERCGVRPAIITWKNVWYGQEIEVICGEDLAE